MVTAASPGLERRQEGRKRKADVLEASELMEETVLEAGAEAPAVVVEEEAVVEEAVAYTGVDGEERPSQPAGFHLHLQEYQPQVGTRLVYVGFSHSSIVGVGWVWYP